MPESEPKPRLIELVDPGVGQGWKAVLKNGKSVVIHEIPVPAAEAAGAVPRIQRLFDHRHPALSPVLAWGTDPNGLWVAVEPNEGVPLGTILSRGPLTPPAAAALGAALLSGVAALHEAGIAMGGFGAASVRVNGNGEVRLAGHPAGTVRGAPSQSDLRADVRSSGMAICAAFGVDPAGAPAPPNIPPGLVVTMRSMASGAMGPAADRAQGALREMASALLAPDRMTASQAELATRAGGREMPSITPFLPKTEGPAADAPAPQPPPFVPTVPREDTPLPRAAASYDPPPRAPEPSPPGPAMPSAYAPYSPPPPFVTSPPVPPPAETAPPSPFGTTVPPPAAPTAAPSTFGTNDPAPATWETAAPAPQEAPPASAPYEPPAAPAAPMYEPPSATPTPAPTPAAPESTWTPMATPVWTPTGPVAGAPVDFTTETAAPKPATVPPPTAARRPSVPPQSRAPRERPSWLIPAAIAVLVLLLLGGAIGIYLKTRPSSAPIAHATPSPKTSPKASPKSSPTPTNTGGTLPVPTFAPASVTPVTSVAFCIQTTHPCQGVNAVDYTNCKLNASCKVMVEMKFSTPQNTNVGYTLKFFDRCTGTTTNLPGTSFKPTGFTRVDLLKVVTLPTGVKSGALVAVSNSPAVAASAPLLLGSDTC